MAKAKEKEQVIKEARDLIGGLEDFIGNEVEFDRRLDKVLNDWKEAQKVDEKMIPLTIDEVAAILKIAPRTLLEWLRNKKIKGVKMGKEWRIFQKDLDAFLHSLE